MFKIIRPDDVAEIDMEAGRGTQMRLIDASLGTVAIDLHINRLRPVARAGVCIGTRRRTTSTSSATARAR